MQDDDWRLVSMLQLVSDGFRHIVEREGDALNSPVLRLGKAAKDDFDFIPHAQQEASE